MELLFALTISSIVAVGLFAFFGTTSQTYTDQAAAARMQQNATTAMTMITRDIRMAGTSSSTACAQVALFPMVTANNASGGMITIRIRMDDPASRTEVAPPGQSQSNPTLRVVSTAGFVVGNWALITDGVQCTLLTVTGVDVANPGLQHNPLSDTNSPGGANYLYPAASSLVYRVPTNRFITYRVDTSDPRAPWLTREITDCTSLISCTGTGRVRVAPDIESLRFSYVMNDGTVVNDPSTIATVAQAANIRLVDAIVTSRAERPSRLAGGDGFRRHALASSIQLRNLR